MWFVALFRVTRWKRSADYARAHGAWIVTHSGKRRADIRVPAAARHERNGAFREHPRELARVKPPLADAPTRRRAASHLTVKMYAS
jgi:hypothetical protein